jgi:hypothetical protein
MDGGAGAPPSINRERGYNVNAGDQFFDRAIPSLPRSSLAMRALTG